MQDNRVSVAADERMRWYEYEKTYEKKYKKNGWGLKGNLPTIEEIETELAKRDVLEKKSVKKTTKK
jgi:hypothetical protein